MFDQPRLITAYSAIETLAMFAACLTAADLLSGWTKGSWIELPTFIWALASGVVIRNVLTHVFRFEMFDRAIDVFGNASLSLFLAMALLSLRLWELADLAGPVAIILAVQVLVMMAWATFVTYRFMGADYDAAVVAAGHCGFGLGATPTAIANMQAITDRFGPSYKAYLVVPLVGAFFVDLVNATILQIFTQLPFLR
jgi:ESS family glutamate:Na+ symporter